MASTPASNAGLVGLLQRTFTVVTGNTSDAAVVISALPLAAVFTPIRSAAGGGRQALQAHIARAHEQWADREFRSAVEAIVRDVTSRPD